MARTFSHKVAVASNWSFRADHKLNDAVRVASCATRSLSLSSVLRNESRFRLQPTAHSTLAWPALPTSPSTRLNSFRSAFSKSSFAPARTDATPLRCMLSSVAAQSVSTFVARTVPIMCRKEVANLINSLDCSSTRDAKRSSRVSKWACSSFTDSEPEGASGVSQSSLLSWRSATAIFSSRASRVAPAFCTALRLPLLSATSSSLSESKRMISSDSSSMYPLWRRSCFPASAGTPFALFKLFR